jgi:AcrR family transcriptional regulator
LSSTRNIGRAAGGLENLMQETLLATDSKRERAKAANREAILSAAKRVFAQIGYGAATVRDIIRATDLASGTFYNYFRSKEEVFEALADDSAMRFRPILRDAHDRAKDFEDFVRRAILGYFLFLRDEHGAGAVPIGERGPHVRTDTPQMMTVYEEIKASIEDAIAQGTAPPVDADYLASACIGLSRELGEAMLKRDPPDVESAAAFATGIILGGLRSIRE